MVRLRWICCLGFVSALLLSPGARILEAQDLFGVYLAPDAQHGWAVGPTYEVLYSRDGGATWTPQICDNSARLFGVEFVDLQSGWAVGDSAYVYHTNSGGVSWELQLAPPNPISKFIQKVDFLDANNGWACAGDGQFARTRDGGVNWEPGSVLLPPLRFIDYFGLSVFDTSRCWMAGGYPDDNSVTYGQIVRTVNGGRNWTLQWLDTLRYDLNDVDFVDTLYGWAVGGRDLTRELILLHTTNGGTLWSAQTPPSGYFLRAVCFVDRNNGWAVGDSGTILRTSNGGTTWLAQPSGTDARLRDVSFVDPSHGVVVGDGTALYTTNGGTVWSKGTLPLYHRRKVTGRAIVR